MKISHSEQGSVLIEFSLLIPLLIFMLVGVVDLSLAIQQSMLIVDAARAGTEFGMIPGNSTNFSGMQTAAANAAKGLSGFSAVASNWCSCSPGGTVVSCAGTCPGYGTPLEYVQVKTSATVPVFLKYSGLPLNIPLNGFSVVRIEWAGTGG